MGCARPVELCPTATGSAADPRHKRGPRGLALNDSAQRLYVLNRIANTISILDTAGNTCSRKSQSAVTTPTPQVISRGPRIPLRFEAQRQRHHGLRRLPH